MSAVTIRRGRLVRLATAFDDANETINVEIPEDLDALTSEELAALREEATTAFDMLYEAESTPESLAAMEQLADGVDRIREAEDARAEAARLAAERAEELAARVRTEMASEPEAEVEAEVEEEPEAEADEEPVAEVEPDPEPVAEEPEPIAASAGPIKVTVSGKRRIPAPEPAPEPTPAHTLVASGDLGRGVGTQLTLPDLSEAFADKLRSINYGAMRSASTSGKRSVQSFSIGSYHKQFPEELQVRKGVDTDEVLKRAVDESRLPGGSLVASAGWCAPSEVIYDLAEAAETTDGVFSLPEVQVDRGGLRHTLGPDFQSIYTEDDLSWSFTEDEVEAGDYDGYGEGSKPCFFVPCPEFVDDRLDVAGICIRAGLLQNRAYPETIQRLVSGALVAHEFKMARRRLGVIQAESTLVTMPADPVGLTAPVLQAIEVQVEDYKQRHRIGRGRTLEAVFPYWTRGAIRADLSRRLGVELFNVTNETINSWFALRGVNAQFVYELDDLTGNAADRTEWPEELTFLLYLSGTWIAGTSAVIDLEAVFDSALVEQNIYTQLFTEEGWLVAKRFHDSRKVTVPICASGHTAGGVEVDCDGSENRSML